MITKLQLNNFKCFENFSMDLKNVNVFTGINGMGKSTVIQSLLLLAQSYYQDKENKGLILNGKYAELGLAQDVVYDKASQDILEIDVINDKGDTFANVFEYKQDMDYLPFVKQDALRFPQELNKGKFVYISAYRIKPQGVYAAISEEELRGREFGINGEFALQYLAMYSYTDVSNDKILIKDSHGNSLLNQTRIWMDRISPGVAPRIKTIMANRSTELEFDFIEGENRTNSYKNVNVGFGITYVLPVVTALLTAKEGDLIIIENPEAHIHPAGQRMLGELIARAGAGGAQIMVETHSEHIVNGIRIEVKQNNIEKEDVNIAFFYKDGEDSYRHKYEQLHVNADGKMSDWPEGFFDEWEKALLELMQ